MRKNNPSMYTNMYLVQNTCRVPIQPNAPVATAATSLVTERVGMPTRPDSERSGAVEIATRKRPRHRGVWDLRELIPRQPQKHRRRPKPGNPAINNKSSVDFVCRWLLVCFFHEKAQKEREHHSRYACP